MKKIFIIFCFIYLTCVLKKVVKNYLKSIYNIEIITTFSSNHGII